MGEVGAVEEFVSRSHIIGQNHLFSLQYLGLHPSPHQLATPMPRAEVVPTNELGTFHIPTSPTIEEKTKKPPKHNITRKAKLKMVYYATMNRLMHITNL